MITRAALIQQAASYVGSPFHHQGRVKGVGIDCIGLIAGPAKDLGSPEAIAFLNDPACQGYSRTPDPKMMLRACAAYLDEIKPEHAGVGDILLMQFERDPQHFALITSFDPARIVHAAASVGKVVEHRLDATWRSRVVRAYRYRGIV